MAPEFPKVRDITNVIALARFVHIAQIQLASGHLLDPLDRFQHRNTVYTPAAQVVHLAGPRICSKLFDGPHHVMTVNIVTHLLALIAKTGIPAATKDRKSTRLNSSHLVNSY